MSLSAARPQSAVVAILALSLGTFAIGTAEFMTMGILPEMAASTGISLPTASHLVAAYAVGVVVGAPVLALVGSRFPPKGMLLSLMAAYGAFNALTAVVHDYDLLLAVRFLAGLPHGAYFGFASIVAAQMVAPRNRGRAVSSVLMGLSVATVAGLPAATWLGQELGWRWAFAAVAAVAATSVLLVASCVPRAAAVALTPTEENEVGARVEAVGAAQFRVFGDRQFLLTLAAGAIGFGGLFAVFTYISPIATQVAGLPPSSVPVFLLAFGLGMTVGNWVGGEVTHLPVYTVLIGGSVANAFALLVFGLMAPHGWWAALGLFVMSAVNMVVVVNIQLRLMTVARDAGSEALGASMNHSAFNVANALGAWLGGLTIGAGLGYRSTTIVGAGLCLAGMLVLLVSLRVHRSTQERERQIVPAERLRSSAG